MNFEMKLLVCCSVVFVALVDRSDAFGLVQQWRFVGRSSVFSTELLAEGSTITMPALSSTMKEGRVVSWLKSEGDAIEAGEAIMVVESDKADMDVEAFEDGFLAKIIVEEGGMAPVGEAVALIAETEADIASVVASFDGSAPTATTSAPVSTSTTAASEGGLLLKLVRREP